HPTKGGCPHGDGALRGGRCAHRGKKRAGGGADPWDLAQRISLDMCPGSTETSQECARPESNPRKVPTVMQRALRFLLKHAGRRPGTLPVTKGADRTAMRHVSVWLGLACSAPSWRFKPRAQ